MIVELSENQKDILNFLIKEAVSEDPAVLLEHIKSYNHCSLEGDDWTLIEEDIILLMYIFQALDEKVELIRNIKKEIK